MANNNFHISIPVSGLIKREDYKYDIVGVGANWPAVASPSSGTFTASSKLATINTTISFLPTTGQSAPNILSYNLLSCGYNDSEIFTNVVAKVTSLSDNCIVLSPTQLVQCSGCLPSIGISIIGHGSQSSNQYVLSNGNNVFDFTSSLSELEPNTTYNYTVKSVGANWPIIMVSPSGGSFTANSTTYLLSHKLMFCPYSGISCGSSNVLNHDLRQCFNTNNLYGNIEVSISPNYCANEKTFSNIILVNCKDCLPKTTAVLPNKLVLSSSNLTTISGSLSGLIPNTTYNYAFNTIDSNWPSILKNISGTIRPTGTSYSLENKLMFCYPSGNCQAGTDDLLPYTLDTIAEKDFNQKKLYTDLVLNLTPSCGDGVISNQCRIECDDCLPCVRYASVVFSGSPLIVLPQGCCQGQKFISVNVSNAIPGDKYTYSFDSIPSTGTVFLTFSPSTGEIYFGSGGYGKVNTIMSTNLTDYAQTLLTFELTHTNTNTKIHDTIGLACRTNCSV